MNLLRKGAEWLERQRHEHMSDEVEYRRGTVLLTPSATIGSTVFDVVDDYGHLTRVESRDFLIRVSDLVMDGQVVEPQKGDLITEGGCTYEVLSPADEPEWRYSDDYRQTFRIHTKKV